MLTVLLPLTSLAQFNSSCALVSLTAPLYAWTVYLYSLKVTCPCFQLLYSHFCVCVCLNFARRTEDPCSTTQISCHFFLTSFSLGWSWVFDLEEHDPWILSIFLGLLIPLDSSHGTISNRSLKHSETVLFRSRAVFLVFALLSLLQMLNSTTSWSL